MRSNSSNAIIRMVKIASFGFLGGTAIIHITPLVGKIVRNFEDRYLSEKHPEHETALLLIVGFLTMVMEPVTYIVNLAICMDKHGFMSLLWLAPLALSQSFALQKTICSSRVATRSMER
jgi:hypothetical protein